MTVGAVDVGVKSLCDLNIESLSQIWTLHTILSGTRPTAYKRIQEARLLSLSVDSP